jgi:hypothetical protein
MRLYLIKVTLSSTFNSLNSGICLKNDKRRNAGTERAFICCKSVVAYIDGFHGRPSRAAKIKIK